MLGSQFLLSNRQRTPIQRLRRRVVALGAQQPGEVVREPARFGMLLPQHLLGIRQRPPIKRLRPGVVALGLQQPREVVQARARRRML